MKPLLGLFMKGNDMMQCKSAAKPMPSLRFQTTIETFQMRYCMTFYLKGHQNCQKSKLKVPKKSPFIK